MFLRTHAAKLTSPKSLFMKKSTTVPQGSVGLLATLDYTFCRSLRNKTAERHQTCPLSWPFSRLKEPSNMPAGLAVLSSQQKMRPNSLLCTKPCVHPPQRTNTAGTRQEAGHQTEVKTKTPNIDGAVRENKLKKLEAVLAPKCLLFYFFYRQLVSM